MSLKFFQIAFTPSVLDAQQRYNRRETELPADDGTPIALGPEEQAFILERDSFYLATVSETGWPYIQHRGGARGFLRVLDERTLAFADFGGNRQFITVGNLTQNDRVALFLMDYSLRARLKVLGRARIVDAGDDAELAQHLTIPNYRARIERLVVIHVVAFDWNCSQHITPRHSTGGAR